MANGLYDAGRAGFLAGDAAWDGDTFKVVLVDGADYSRDLVVHDFLDDVAVGGRVATSGALGSKTTTTGIADAADVTFTGVTGDPSEQLIIYKDSGVDATSLLILNIDTATGLPVTPNSGDIIVTWDNGTNKIFKL